jgi:ElaB/YqjD/DUF883 family membrane-anchored ribosome-binding protein
MSYATNSAFKSALSDAEDLVKAAASLGDENFSRLRTKAEQSLRDAKSRIAEAQDGVRLRAMYAAEAVDRKVSAHPWESMGIVAAAALALGFAAGLSCRRSD